MKTASWIRLRCFVILLVSTLMTTTISSSKGHFQTNPYGFEQDILKPHGKDVIEVERSFEGIRDYLANNYIEGIVFWKDGEPKCKIKRKDFGFPWKTDKR